MATNLHDKADVIRIDGIKFSEKLILYNFLDSSAQAPSSINIIQSLRRHQLNMPYLTIALIKKKTRISFCVAAEDQNHVERLLGEESNKRGDLEIIPSVGLVTLFPHQSSLNVLGFSLSVFGKAGLPVYGMASSLSTLTFVTTYDGLDRAGEYIQKYLSLPEQHAPFRPEFRIKPVSRK